MEERRQGSVGPGVGRVQGECLVHVPPSEATALRRIRRPLHVADRQLDHGRNVIRLEHQGPFQELRGTGIPFVLPSPLRIPPSEEELVRLRVGPLRGGRAAEDLAHQIVHHVAGDGVLKGEEVRHGSLVGRGEPHHSLGGGELHPDPDPVCLGLNRPREHVLDTQESRDLRIREVLTTLDHSRRAPGCHLELGNLRQEVRHLFGHAHGEVGPTLGGGEVGEGEDGDGACDDGRGRAAAVVVRQGIHRPYETQSSDRHRREEDHLEPAHGLPAPFAVEVGKDQDHRQARGQEELDKSQHPVVHPPWPPESLEDLVRHPRGHQVGDRPLDDLPGPQSLRW